LHHEREKFISCQQHGREMHNDHNGSISSFVLLEDYDQKNSQTPNSKRMQEALPSEKPPFPMWEGETLLSVFHFVGEAYSEISSGTIYITSAFLYYHSQKLNNEPLKTTKIALQNIYEIREELNAPVNVSSLNFDYSVFIQCKDSRVLKFTFQEESHASKFGVRLKELCFVSLEETFAFYNIQFMNTHDWHVLSWQREMDRLQLHEHFRITEVNKDFLLCSSYPEQFIVPKHVTDQDLREMASFRSKNRVAALCWYSTEHKVSMFRCSQPMSGWIGWARSPADERVVDCIRKLDGMERSLTIVDCRSRTNAVANQARSGGTENIQNYKNCSLIFLDIGNIHSMRQALKDIHERASNYEDGQALWLKYIRSILQGSVKIASLLLKQKCSVLVHCSDGWDRTSQVTALSQIIVDGYFRTIAGFQVLIEKEWLSFGHKFNQRLAHGSSEFWGDEQSPVFLQFLDCVHQLFQCAPRSFEFNETYLITIMEQAWSCSFGTFMGDNPMQRRKLDLENLTPAVWGYLNSSEQVERFKNPLYQPGTNSIAHLIKLNKDLKFWYDIFPSTGLTQQSPESLLRKYYEAQLAATTGQLKQWQSGAVITTLEGQKAFLVTCPDVSKFSTPYTIIDDYEPTPQSPQRDDHLSDVQFQNETRDWIVLGREPLKQQIE